MRGISLVFRRMLVFVFALLAVAVLCAALVLCEGRLAYGDEGSGSYSATSAEWNIGGIQADSSVRVGDTVFFSAAVGGADAEGAGLTYNYAWAYGNSGWDDWSSTVKETGSMTSAAEGSFTPARPGTYRVWVNVADASGRRVTSGHALVEVSKLDWAVGAASAPASAKAGDAVPFSAAVGGADAEGAGLTYNYAWAYGESGWDDWSSTVKETGSMTSAAEGSFTPARPGTYRVWVNVADRYGRRVTSGHALVRVADLNWSATGLADDGDSWRKRFVQCDRVGRRCGSPYLQLRVGLRASPAGTTGRPR